MERPKLNHYPLSIIKQFEEPFSKSSRAIKNYEVRSKAGSAVAVRSPIEWADIDIDELAENNRRTGSI